MKGGEGTGWSSEGPCRGRRGLRCRRGRLLARAPCRARPRRACGSWEDKVDKVSLEGNGKAFRGMRGDFLTIFPLESGRGQHVAPQTAWGGRGTAGGRKRLWTIGFAGNPNRRSDSRRLIACFNFNGRFPKYFRRMSGGLGGRWKATLVVGAFLAIAACLIAFGSGREGGAVSLSEKNECNLWGCTTLAAAPAGPSKRSLALMSQLAVEETTRDELRRVLPPPSPRFPYAPLQGSLCCPPASGGVGESSSWGF